MSETCELLAPLPSGGARSQRGWGEGKKQKIIYEKNSTFCKKI